MQIVIWGADEQTTVYQVPSITVPSGADGQDGADGQSAVITVFTDEAAFNAYAPGPLELAVLTDA